MWTRAPAFLCAIAACRGDIPASEDRSSPVDPQLYLYPRSIHFPRVHVGATATASLTLRNDGNEDIDVDGLLPSSDTLVVDDVGSFRLAPGEQQVRTVHWTPSTEDTLDEQLDVIVVPRPPAATEVPVTGFPVFGVLDMPWGTQDFGTIPVECERELVFQIVNRGLGDLTFESVTLSGADEFTMKAVWPDSSGKNPGGAQTEGFLEAGDVLNLWLTFVPTTPGFVSEATLHIESDDLRWPVVDATLTAIAVEKSISTSLSWDVPPPPTAFTSLIDVNAQVAPDVRDAFGSFFDVLRNSGIPFRVAIIGTMTESGAIDPSVAGPYAYIDPTFSAEETDQAVGAMLDGIERDEDRGLELLESAIAEHRDWLLDEDPLWQSSTLHLTVVNADVEQSPAPADYYVDKYEAYKDDAASVVVNGIAGRPPRGCDTGPGAAWGYPSLALSDATLQTGGVFLSICDDWSTNLALLAEHMVRPVFPLDGVPLDANITVTLDGTEVDSGWVYDPQTNAIRFDDDSYPVEGSVVGIRYGAVPECD